tara:strand:- start:438 stop:647 length:210 start_codon:yes stop_codon:yes gene_type:complete
MALEQKDQLLEEQKAKMDAEREQINAKAQEEAIAQAAERLVLAFLDDEILQLDTAPKPNNSENTPETEV